MKEVTCPVCNGSGVFVDDLGYTISRRCPCCKGNKKVVVEE